ncbi:uncharacterized protein LOC122006610 [Zingiber officinale]|uniref:uncharacterized protein LOC122006610 n=1 Tax=Zingiber officinale TaxID=94328 RepID=UPI001C4C55AD|nr:uncharacterized protein LOC122006610 [Zingiber officinale]
MDSTSSSASSSPSPSPSPSRYGIVEMELDAAVALANLAGQAAAVGTSSPAHDNPTQGICSSSAAAEHSSDMAGSRSLRPSTKRGTRQSMTQAEKEERRMRRVLANRESARQTIRRRQALRDELTKKVAYLRLENDSMKLEKELATQEYLSLRGTNALLKEQIAITVRGEIDINSAATEMEPSDQQTAAGSVRPLFVPACAWFLPLPHEGSTGIGSSSSLTPCQSAAENEKGPRGDLQVKLATTEDEQYQDAGSRQIQTPDEVLHKVATASAAAAEARKRRKELTKLKHHYAR